MAALRMKCPKIGSVPAVNLKGVGIHAAVPAGLLKKGDVVVHNHGIRYNVMKAAVLPTSPNAVLLHLAPMTMQKYQFGDLKKITLTTTKSQNVGVSKNTLMKRYVNVRASRTVIKPQVAGFKEKIHQEIHPFPHSLKLNY